MSRSSCAISSLRVARSFSRISVGKIHLSYSRAWEDSHGFVTASLAYSAVDFSGFARGSLDILLLRPRFNAFSRGFPEGYSRRRFFFVRSLFDDFLIVANGTFSPLCRRFTLTAPACPSSAHRCESKERNASPYRFTERSFWLCHFGICKCPILCHSGIVWRSTSSRTMPKRHNQ